MSYIVTHPRAQLMLPSSIDDYVSKDNIVRFIDAFVDKVLPLRAFSQSGRMDEGRPYLILAFSSAAPVSTCLPLTFLPAWKL